MNQTTKKTESKKASRVFLINKRDKIDEYIYNSVAKYNEFLAQKNETSEFNDLNNLVKNKQEYFQKSTTILDQIKQMKTEILSKNDQFVTDIKSYARTFINDAKISAKQKAIALEKSHEVSAIKIKNQISILEEEKLNLEKLRLDTAEKVKTKIEAIRKELHNEQKFDFASESEQIKKLYLEHKQFVRDKIESKLISLNSKLTKLYDLLKKQAHDQMGSTAQVIRKAKEMIKEEFIFLADIEKKVIKKIIYFKDFLEDVEYFTNDKTRKYEIVLAKAKKIKAESSHKIMQDVNEILAFISSSKGMFDNVNSLLRGINSRTNNKVLDRKLSKYKESVLNATTSKLLVNKVEEEF